MKKISNKGQLGLNNLGTVALSVGIFIIIVGVVASILTQVQATQTTNSVAFNTTADGLTAMSLFGDWASIVVIVAIASIVITIIVLAFRVVG